jgi:CheY-like chemotaxis protein
VDPDVQLREDHRYLITPVTRSGLLEVLQALVDPLGEGESVKGAQPKPPPGSTVLVAEDHEINRLVVQKILLGWGYEVLFANNGTEALRLFVETQPRLVLMDIEMPGLDGFETARAIRARCLGEQQESQVPIIAVTAHLAADLRQRCLASGMDDLVGKPLSREELGGRLTRWEEVLEGSLSRSDARYGGFEALSDWPEKFLSLLNSNLSTLAAQADQADMATLSEAFEKFEELAFSAGLNRWGGMCASLQRPLRLEEVRETVQTFQQEWPDLAPTLVSGT